MNVVKMIQRCAEGQRKKGVAGWDGTDWATLPLPESGEYHDLLPEAYLDPGDQSAIRRQRLFLVKEEVYTTRLLDERTRRESPSGRVGWDE